MCSVIHLWHYQAIKKVNCRVFIFVSTGTKSVKIPQEMPKLKTKWHHFMAHDVYTPCFRKKTPTHTVGYKLRNSCLILIIFDIKIPDII